MSIISDEDRCIRCRLNTKAPVSSFLRQDASVAITGTTCSSRMVAPKNLNRYPLSHEVKGQHTVKNPFLTAVFVSH
jgi:hypothetical protein